MSHKLYTTYDMNKRYYVTPQADTIHLSVENALLSASPEGFSKDLFDDEPGGDELTNQKDFGGVAPWAE